VPLPLLLAYVEMLPRLNAAERIDAFNVARMATGMHSKDGLREMQRVVDGWQQAAAGDHKSAPRVTKEERREMAAKLGIPIRRKRRRPPDEPGSPAAGD